MLNIDFYPAHGSQLLNVRDDPKSVLFYILLIIKISN